MDTSTPSTRRGGTGNGAPTATPPGQNRLLRGLPAEIYEQILPTTKREELTLRQTLWTRGESITRVYFPETCVLSLIVELKGDAAVEAGTIGREGIAGLPVALGVDDTVVTAICQVAGQAVSMTASDFRASISEFPAFQTVVLRYAQALLDETAQSVACNALHMLEQRCARWLAMTRDRVGSEEVRLTHEFLAYMLGVRRAGVTEALLTLKRQGLIDYSRGRIMILDSVGLEAAACECYGIGKSRMDFLVP